jgi:hypothetical protein
MSQNLSLPQNGSSLGRPERPRRGYSVIFAAIRRRDADPHTDRIEDAEHGGRRRNVPTRAREWLSVVSTLMFSRDSSGLISPPILYPQT